MSLPFFISTSSDVHSYKGYTLILPLPSLSSLPQLSADLLLHHPALQFSLVGFLDPTLFVPFAGPKDYVKGSAAINGVCVPAEVYVEKSKGWVVVQQRSPVLKARKKEFVKLLNDWISKEGFVDALAVACVSDEGRSDVDIVNPSPLRYFSLSSDTTDLTSRLKNLTPYRQIRGQDPSDPKIPYFPAAGILRLLLQSTASNTTQNVKPETLLIYASEGDNSVKVVLLFGTLLRVLGLEEGQVTKLIESRKEPMGWKGLWGDGEEDQRNIWS